MALHLATELERENRGLRARLAEAEEALRAMAAGEVDAFVIPGPEGDQVFTLEGADQAYRVMVQGMAEGAVTLTRTGLILFANEQFARLVRNPLERVIGANWQDFIIFADSRLNSQFLEVREHWKVEARLGSGDSASVPVLVSVENLVLNGQDRLCVIVTDLSEQKRNDAIVKSEKLARLILEQAAEGILVIDPSGRITHASRAAEQVSGKGLLGSHFDQSFDVRLGSGKRILLAELLSMAERDQRVKNLELSALHPDGRKIEVLVSLACLTGSDSTSLGCVINLTDITDRKRKELQLRFQAGIIETTSEAVVAIDPDHKVTFWNSAAERLYGISSAKALGRPLVECYQYAWLSADDEARSYSELAEYGVWHGENIHLRRDGTRIFVSSTVNVMGGEHGGGAVAVIRDVSDTKRAYALLEESAARERARAAEYQAIMDVVPAGVFIARDADCLEITGNQMASELLRTRVPENLSKSAPDDQRPEHFQVVKDGKEVPPDELPIQKAARTGQPILDYECEIVLRDGTTRWWIENAVPLFDDTGVSRGAVGAFLDITERKLAELEIQKRAVELARANEDLLHFAYAASHDLQAPLRNVTTFAQLLAINYKAKLDEKGVKIINTIVEASAHMDTMLRDLLQFATVAGSEARIEESVNLEETLTIVLQNLMSTIQESGAIITHDLLPTLAGDSSEFIQLFQNLIGNSLKYRKANIPPVLHISAQEKHAEWVITIGDNGIGFDSKYRDRIFGVFQRLHGTEFAGTGIGLTICKRIVERRGGRIWADGSPGEGATFSFSIPTGISQRRLNSLTPSPSRSRTMGQSR